MLLLHYKLYMYVTLEPLDTCTCMCGLPVCTTTNLLPISIHFFSRYFAVVFKNIARSSFAFINGTTIANLTVGGNDGIFHDRTSTNAHMIHNDASFQFCTFTNAAMAAHHRRFQQHFFGQNAFFTHDRTFSSFIDADPGDQMFHVGWVRRVSGCVLPHDNFVVHANVLVHGRCPGGIDRF